MAWLDFLKDASFRGTQFSVLSGRSRFGRRNAKHEYPFRDTPWFEDIGRASREIRLVGYIVAAPGGDASDVFARRDALVAAAETQNPGTLMHPTLGSLTVSLESVEVEESIRGRMFGLQMLFMEAGLKVFPSAQLSTTQAGQVAAANAYLAAATDFANTINAAYKKGAAVVMQVQLTIAQYQRKVELVVDDATNAYNAVATLPGSVTGVYGRYFGGRTISGFFAAPNINQNQTVDGLLAQSTLNQLTIQNALTQLVTDSQGNSPAAISADTQALLQAIQTASIDPADGIRILGQLAVFQPATYSTTAPIGMAVNTAITATGDQIRRAAVVALAQAALAYQPSSYDDAVNIRTIVTTALDVEIQTAGDQGDDASFTALLELRSAVALDLTSRGASLASIQTFTSGRPYPAPAWALRIYRDNTRADQLTIQVDPVHPGFFPTTFRALGS